MFGPAEEIDICLVYHQVAELLVLYEGHVGGRVEKTSLAPFRIAQGGFGAHASGNIYREDYDPFDHVVFSPQRVFAGMRPARSAFGPAIFLDYIQLRRPGGNNLHVVRVEPRGLRFGEEVEDGSTKALFACKAHGPGGKIIPP